MDAGLVARMRTLLTRALSFVGHDSVCVPGEGCTCRERSQWRKEVGAVLTLIDEPGQAALPTVGDAVENIVKATLELHEHNRSATARALGIGERTLYRWLDGNWPHRGIKD